MKDFLFNPAPVESVWAFPTHCTRCGRAMAISLSRRGFDPTTGRPVMVEVAECSVSSWQLFLGSRDHDSFIVSPRPDPAPAPPRSLESPWSHGDAGKSGAE